MFLSLARTLPDAKTARCLPLSRNGHAPNGAATAVQLFRCGTVPRARAWRTGTKHLKKPHGFPAVAPAPPTHLPHAAGGARLDWGAGGTACLARLRVAGAVPGHHL